MAAKKKPVGERGRTRRALGASLNEARKGKRTGPRSKVEDPEVVKEALRMAAKGMLPASVSRVLGLSRGTVDDWLDRGELWIEEVGDATGDPYAEFYTEWHRALEGSKEIALERMLHAKDERMVERWLARVDRDGEYLDWEKLRIAEAGRAQVQILNTPANMAAAMAGVRERMKVEGRTGPAQITGTEWKVVEEVSGDNG